MSHAGQAVVQMARSTVNGLEYAIKFFVARSAFDVERDMYGQSKDNTEACGLSQFLPQVRHPIALNRNLYFCLFV